MLLILCYMQEEIIKAKLDAASITTGLNMVREFWCCYFLLLVSFILFYFNLFTETYCLLLLSKFFLIFPIPFPLRTCGVCLYQSSENREIVVNHWLWYSADIDFHSWANWWKKRLAYQFISTFFPFITRSMRGGFHVGY